MRNDLQLSPWEISHSGGRLHDDFLESVFFLGNGRMGLRAYLPLASDCRPVQKGLYLAGIFGEIKPGITDIVNLPTPVFEELCIDGNPAQLCSGVERRLDLKTATLSTSYTLAHGQKSVYITHERFFPKEQPALIMQRLHMRPDSGMRLTVASGIDCRSCNSPIHDDQTKHNSNIIQLSRRESFEALDDGLRCGFEIAGSGLRVSEEIRFKSDGLILSALEGQCLVYEAMASPGKALCLDKAACILSSRDADCQLAPLPEVWDYPTVYAEHCAAWEKQWARLSSPTLDDELLCALRYSSFQLMGSCSRSDPGISIGARGLSHGRYKGCYFWDTELFMLPFFIKNDPTAAKTLCQYRFRALPAARENAKKMNSGGARYPWMAAFDGSEQCETWDIGCSEVHITADVAYALNNYCLSCRDEEFYLDCACEVFIETARFWQERYTLRRNGSADLLFCKGPDEYCGITSNNLFTNVMVRHNLQLALEAASALKAKRPHIYERLGISDTELRRFEALAKAVKLPRDRESGHLRQDDSLHLLEDVCIDQIKSGKEPAYHRVCFDRLQRYKLIKQADVLLIMTRFPEIFTKEEKLWAWEDFEPICLHDSTLSFASHALFALQNGLKAEGMRYLRDALLLDLRDVMGNTGSEGLHLACMGEAWSAAQYI